MKKFDLNKLIFAEIVQKIISYLSKLKLMPAEVTLLNENEISKENTSSSIIIEVKSEYFPIILQSRIIKEQAAGIFPVAVFIKMKNLETLAGDNLNLFLIQLEEYITTLFTAVSTSIVADRDMLTGYLNKVSILKHIQKLLTKSSDTFEITESQYFSALENNRFEKYFLLMADIDDFKKFNSLYGYTVGDFVITSVAVRISDFFKSRKQDHYAGRYGGEEFRNPFPG